MTAAGRASGDTASLVRTTLLVGAILLAFIVGLGVLWIASTAVLIIFAGILLAAALDAATRALGRALPVRHRFRLGLVIAVLGVLLVAALTWGGTTLASQFSQLMEELDSQAGQLMTQLRAWGLDLEAMQLQGLLPNIGSVFGGATNAIFGLFGAIGNLLVVLFLGIFFAAEPALYKRGLVNLIAKPRRARVSDVLDKAGSGLRGWLLGQSISMAVIFVLTWALLAAISMPYAFLLALQAGLFVFIPTLGPAFAGVIIMLGGLAQGPEMAAWGLGVYVLIQLLESNLLTPIVQKRTVLLPPAFTLGFQLVMGALFGILGLALAVPIAAAAKILVEELYVKDALGGPWSGEPSQG